MLMVPLLLAFGLFFHISIVSGDYPIEQFSLNSGREIFDSNCAGCHGEKGDGSVFKGAFNYAKQSLAIIIRTIRDYKPMKFFGTIGLVLFLVGSIFDLFLLVHYLLTGVFTPYIFIGFIGSCFQTCRNGGYLFSFNL